MRTIVGGLMVFGGCKILGMQDFGDARFWGCKILILLKSNQICTTLITFHKFPLKFVQILPKLRSHLLKFCPKKFPRGCGYILCIPSSYGTDNKQ